MHDEAKRYSLLESLRTKLQEALNTKKLLEQEMARVEGEIRTLNALTEEILHVIQQNSPTPVERDEHGSVEGSQETEETSAGTSESDSSASERHGGEDTRTVPTSETPAGDSDGSQKGLQ